MPDEQKLDIAQLRQQLKEHKQIPHETIRNDPYLVGIAWLIARLPKQGPASASDLYDPDGLDAEIIKGCLTALHMKLERLEAQNAGLWQRIDTLERERAVSSRSSGS